MTSPNNTTSPTETVEAKTQYLFYDPVKMSVLTERLEAHVKMARDANLGRVTLATDLLAEAAEAIAAWNTRAAPQAGPTEAVERCAEWLRTNITRLGSDNVEGVAAAMVAEVAASIPAGVVEERLREALEPFIAAAEMGVLTYEAVKAANLRQNGLSIYETVYVGAGSHAAESRISYADWQRMAKLRAVFPALNPESGERSKQGASA